MSKYIIFDNKCKFCSRFSNWVHQSNHSISIIPVRDKEAKSLLRDLDVTFIDLQTIYFIDDKNVFVRSRAVFAICGYLNYPWKIISHFQYLPIKFADYFYKLFAKYRYYF